MRRFNNMRFSQAKQRGIAMLELTVTLIVLAAMAAANLSAKALADKLQFAEMQGASLAEVSSAGNSYLQEFFTELQNGLNITKSNSSISAGFSEGQTMAPTIQNLIDIGKLHTGFSGEASYVSKGLPGHYKFQIYKTGATCGTDPTSCGLDGYVFIDKPVTGPGGVDMDGPALHAMLKKLGNKGCISLLTNPSQMTGLDGDCGISNPIAGNPPGAVLVRFGFDSSGFSQFVRNHDTRDIGLLGNLEVDKTLKADTLITKQKTLGDDCPTNDALAISGGVALICVDKKWKVVGGLKAWPGTICEIDGTVATSNDNSEQLICKNKVFIHAKSLTPKNILINRLSVVDGQIVPKAACDIGGTSERSFLVTQTVVDITQNPPKQGMNVTASDLGNSWQVSIQLVDDAGNVTSGNAYSIQQTMNLECIY